ncbi:MAG: hypothetical protein K8T10_06660 [Candidatus Eremiobacteraeota bacterium]|nr:hypothetical protein [Candidatus Eremiobacteraeota bacterium]
MVLPHQVQPFLKAFLFCANAYETSPGLYNIEGVFEQIVLDEFPATIPIQIFFDWSNLDDSRYKMDIRITPPGAKEPEKTICPFETDEYGRAEYLSAISLDLEINESGEFTFEIILNDKLHGIIYLPILEKDSADE